MSIKKRLGAVLYDAIMRGPEEAGLQQWRRDLLENAGQRVLEIGIGTGANLPHYPRHVEELIAVEPNPAMATRIDTEDFGGRGRVEIAEGYADNLPVDDDSVDSVVVTLVLCSVTDVQAALDEIRRALKPGGSLLFLEHVASCDDRIRTWQDRLDPLWNWCTGDCHMNRRTLQAFEDADYAVEECRREPMPEAPSLVRPTIRGIAVPR